MAKTKAEAIAKQHPKTAILAADTIVAVGRRILGKPTTSTDAEKMLKLIMGRRHQVLTAITLITPDGKTRNRIVTSKLRLKRLDDATIKYYLNTKRMARQSRRLRHPRHRRTMDRLDKRLILKHSRTTPSRNRTTTKISKPTKNHGTPWSEFLRKNPCQQNAQIAKTHQKTPTTHSAQNAAQH